MNNRKEDWSGQIRKYTVLYGIKSVRMVSMETYSNFSILHVGLFKALQSNTTSLRDSLVPLRSRYFKSGLWVSTSKKSQLSPGRETFLILQKRRTFCTGFSQQNLRRWREHLSLSPLTCNYFLWPLMSQPSYVAQWYSIGLLAPMGAKLPNGWRHFWLSYWGYMCYWHLVDRDQGSY